MSVPKSRMSFPPAYRVMSVGSMASAGSSCSSMMWRSRLLRMARLAYSQPGSALASFSATRSAQPRTPLGSRELRSPTPSVKESPKATNTRRPSLSGSKGYEPTPAH